MDTTQLSESIVGEHLERKFSVVQWSEGEDSTICLSEIMSAYCKSKALTRKDPAVDFLEKYCRSEPTSDDRSPRKTIFVLKREIKDLKEENAKLKEMVVQDVPEILRTMKNILDSAVPPKRSRLDLTTPPLPPQSSYSSSANSSPSLPRSTPPSSMSESVTPSLTDSQSSKVEIHPGTGVMVEKLPWTYALNANSATVFVRHLLTAVFPLEILLLSNLRGGKRGGGDARLPLDKNTLDAIYSATLERSGTQLSSIGTTINGKITELRTKNGKTFDLIVMDPPWENKSVKRSRRYNYLPSSQLKRLPIPQLASPNCLVVTWVTNRPSHLRFVCDELYPHWGVQVVAKWFWIKVTTSGQFVFPLDSQHKKPYETLVLGRCNLSANTSASTSEMPELPVEDNRLIVSVPSALHSQKPSLSEVLRPYIGPEAECLELFARNLQPGWTSWGNEVLKFQHTSYFTLTPADDQANTSKDDFTDEPTDTQASNLSETT